MSGIDVALVLLRVAIGCWLLWSVRSLVPARRRADLSSVAVVVPARDEERSLPTLLASFPDGLEVVVVDDGSTDATAAVAERAGARVVAAGPLPDGWAGKPWACARGVETARGETLVFVDADVRFAPGGFAAVVAELQQTGGLVSVQPHHVPERPVEQLAQLFNIVGFAGTDAGSPLGAHRGSRGAFGPVLATSRADYELAGGHRAVRSAVVEDVALGDRYRAEGIGVRIVAGGEAVGFRMYPGGLRQLVEGFTKNLAGGVVSVRRSTVALVVLWSTLLVQGSVAPAQAVVDVASGHAASLVAPIGLYLVVAAQVWWMGRRVGRFAPWISLLFPLSTALFLGVFVRSVVATARGSVSWRGRRVSTRRPPDAGR